MMRRISFLYLALFSMLFTANMPMQEVTAGGTSAQNFIRGDANDDEVVNLADGIKILSYLFLSEAINCPDAADANDDGQIDVTDAVALFSYQFTGSLPPAAPFPNCGVDPVGDTLADCNANSCI